MIADMRAQAAEPTRPTVGILGIPYDAESSFLRGAAAAPPLIRAALWSPASNTWSETGVDLAAVGAIVDAGDLELADPDDRSSGTRDAITAAIGALLNRGERPLIFGGDHSITYPVLRAVRAHHPRLSILHVDAHPDLYDTFEGDRYSHACPFARILEDGLVDRLVQVGIRGMNGHQRAQAERFGVEVVDMRAIHAAPDSLAQISFTMPVYLSLDLDGLDPGFAPGVAHREPGGLSVRQVLALIQGLARRPDAPVIGADIVEYNPTRDPEGLTATVAAKLAKEMATVMLGEPGA
ncbi:MAG TPA: agmatinase [Ktedonobacterales bacterium]|jgi:agmatinase